MIECKKYELKKEFLPLLGITKYQWERRNEDLQEWLKNYFDYEVTGTTHLFITIKEVIGEYQPIPRKLPNKEKLCKEKLHNYEEYTLTQLTEEFVPNSKSRVARNAIEDFGYEKYGHTSAEAVSKRYVKPAFDKHAENEGHRVWVFYDSYKELDKKAIERWRQIMAEEKIGKEERAEAFIKYEQGEDITKEHNAYITAMKRFKSEYGDVPVSVDKWRLKK